MSGYEKLEFEIKLSGTYWNKVPDFSIHVNDQLISTGTVNDTQTFVKFSVELAEYTPHKLKIRLENKTNDDTKTDAQGAIINDMLLNIDTISVDGIELGHLKWSESEFIPDDHIHRPILKNCVNLGWNGAYTLSFEAPFYIWLLERM